MPEKRNAKTLKEKNLYVTYNFGKVPVKVGIQYFNRCTLTIDCSSILKERREKIIQETKKWNKKKRENEISKEGVEMGENNKGLLFHYLLFFFCFCSLFSFLCVRTSTALLLVKVVVNNCKMVVNPVA